MITKKTIPSAYFVGSSLGRTVTHRWRWE